MTTVYDPATATRLIAWARAARPAISETRSVAMAMVIERLNATADQLEAAQREIDRLRRLLAVHVDQTAPNDPIGAALSDVEIDRAGHAARCHDCDLPLATHADWHGTPEGEGANLCWRPWAGDVCCRTPVDWRARALAAEGIVVRLEASLRDIDMGGIRGSANCCGVS